MLEHLARNPPPPDAKKPAPTAKTALRRKRSAPTPAPAPPARPRLMLRLMRLVAALEKLEQFVRHHRAAGTAEIVVVVGKGHRSGESGPVIGPAVRTWCDEHRALVAAYHTAPPSEGGEGALVLRLAPPA